MLRIGIDTGGTFTDLVLVDDESGEHRTAKVASTPAQPSAAVFEALHRSGCDPARASLFVLGTTIATNCLLQRKGQRTVYVTTAGFEDVPFIQRIDRKSLYDLQWQKPVPYVERPDLVGVRERVAHDGSVRVPLNGEEIARIVEEVRARDAATESGVAVAINLLFAYVRPDHERLLAEALREALPDVPVSASHEVAPIWREYERANTVLVDAYLKRLVGGFAEDLDRGLTELGFACSRFLLKSNGGQAVISAAERQPVNFVLSGLAGGLIAGKLVADEVGLRDVVTLDMGGTSADVGVLVDGRIRSSSQFEIEWGLPIAVPVVDLTTVGAGGSSIAGLDHGGFLTVGPESAGADPGPASYGKGGERATVTDANLVLGRLNPDYFLGGELPLDATRAKSAVAQLAARLGCSVEQSASAIVEVACENMANAIRLLCAERGLDYRKFDLVAFGGAGPLHAGMLAQRICLHSVVVPVSPGLAAAFGAQAADLRVDRRMTRLLRSDVAAEQELREAAAVVAREALADLEHEGDARDPTVVVTASARYLGQNFEQEVPIPLDVPGDLLEHTVERFHEQHRLAYGYRLDGTVVEIVHVNATVLERRAKPSAAELPRGTGARPVETRSVYFEESGWAETPIYRRFHLGVGDTISGPAVIEEMDSTTLVLAGQAACVYPRGTLVIEEASGA